MKKRFINFPLVIPAKAGIFALSFFLATNSYASHQHHRSDHHAPIGVMRDHVHAKGEVMISYRYAQMKMAGLRDQGSNVANQSALSSYMAVPKNMKMKMHMYGAMYGVSDDLTLMLSGSYVVKDMEVERRNGTEFDIKTADIKDTKINMMYRLFKNENSHLQFNYGLSIPTGENSEYQSNGTSRMAYPMQSGSGSYELLPGLSYTNLQDNCSFGGQVNSVLRLDSNDNGYKYGDEFNVTAWVAAPLTHGLSISSRLDYTHYDAIEGQDRQISGSASMNPIFDSGLGQGGKLYGYLGSNFLFSNGVFKGNRLALEFGIPLHQRIDGPFLQDDYKLVLGWQKSF